MSRFLIIIVLLLSGCGYQPSSHYVKKVFGDSIYVDVKVDPKEPENAPYLTDEIRKVVLQRFNASLTPKQDDKNSITVRYDGSRFIPTAYSSAGYITRYTTIVEVSFYMVDRDGNHVSKTITQSTQSGVSQSAVDTANIKIQSIKDGITKAVDEFVAYVSAKGVNIE